MFNISSTNITQDSSLINEVKDLNKIIPLELELSQTVTLDQSLVNLDIFKKSQKITFFATCYYTLDFSNLTNDDILIDSKNKTININIDKPINFDIIIDENKTHYYDTELGLLCFSDIKMSSAEYGKILKRLNESFSDKMNDEELYKKCLSNANSMIENILLNLTDETYTVNISFKT